MFGIGYIVSESYPIWVSITIAEQNLATAYEVSFNAFKPPSNKNPTIHFVSK